jgi:hypothetical protein
MKIANFASPVLLVGLVLAAVFAVQASSELVIEKPHFSMRGGDLLAASSKICVSLAKVCADSHGPETFFCALSV